MVKLEDMGNDNQGLDKVGKETLPVEPESFLKKTVAQSLKDYEVRSPQAEVMKACSKTIEEGGVLLAEAGTGTGKTFAYLIPIILSDRKAIISTRTINLQEQLATKDLCFLSSLKEVSYALAKGRGRYLCLRRLNAFRHEEEGDMTEHRRILEWSTHTESGDIEDSDFRRPRLWDKVCSDADACTSKKCAYYERCFYYRARRKWESAQIVVANHSLVSINEMLPPGSRILPPADVLVIDEAHTLEHVLTENIGLSISSQGVERILSRLLRVEENEKYRGLLSNSNHLFLPLASLKAEINFFWDQARNQLKDRQMIRGTFTLRDQMLNLVSSVRAFIDRIRTTTLGLFEENHEIELNAVMSKLTTFADSAGLFSEGRADFVRWAEIAPKSIVLRMSPLYPRDFMMTNVIPKYRSIILTSATLSVSGDFGFMARMLGLEDSEKLTVPSPFNLAEQVQTEVRRDVDLMKGEESIVKLGRIIMEEASRKDGGILVLFTSRDVMRRTWELTSDELSDLGLTPMMQGQDLQNRTMLDIMRNSNDSIIFGLDSFWEGIDVKGDSLTSVLITKLPFETPDDPITMARIEDINRKGGRAFVEYQLPRAILKFKQGVGRLIRSKTDKGRLIICDERVETKSYGGLFVRNLFH